MEDNTSTDFGNIPKKSRTRRSGKLDVTFYTKLDRTKFNTDPGEFMARRKKIRQEEAFNVQRKWDLRRTALLG